ncbi:iron-siderophore ABC transporter substrate-binding protein [Streptomyces sp. HNM0574]|uniref:iron-siderophore ABC transporter substrate-binding protein n=1 Tax=Streptomyces sp. HNM0574 TaxID=2714954 RepID=UPI001469B7E9|nr:iron-siderophore ABC transporter substrate-binding protein [Streptomyces sp. HNM0574]NLU66154.1 iron-siderophore ABC transporter substrate-binding protein [Streptomyces sp. HNM0574]
MRRLLISLAAATAAALTLTSCGTTEPAADEGKKAAGGPVTLTDATGKKVKLDAPAEKVVGTEWNVVENLVSLGVEPAGVADVKGYKTWDTAAPLKNEPEDIGTRGEPSVETVASLKPDLVVATTDLSPSAVKQLRKVAPVLTLKTADAADPVGRMTKNLDLVAEATGTTDRAEKLTKRFESKLADGRKALAEADRDGTEYAFADGYSASGKVTIRPFTEGSLIGGVNEKLGLRNAWHVKGDKVYGLGSTDVEGLTGLDEDVHFAYIGNDEQKSATPFTGPLAEDKVWTSLPFVKKGNVHRLPDGIWMFGGPESMIQYVDAVVAELAGTK